MVMVINKIMLPSHKVTKLIEHPVCEKSEEKKLIGWQPQKCFAKLLIFQAGGEPGIEPGHSKPDQAHKTICPES